MNFLSFTSKAPLSFKTHDIRYVTIYHPPQVCHSNQLHVGHLWPSPLTRGTISFSCSTSLVSCSSSESKLWPDIEVEVSL
jgi:hypothetical protein